jgi:hypothetical protein
MPNQTPRMVEERVLAFSIAHAGLGSRRVSTTASRSGVPDPAAAIHGRIISVTKPEMSPACFSGSATSRFGERVGRHPSLLNLDGTWSIMRKAATHASRADWATPAR